MLSLQKIPIALAPNYVCAQQQQQSSSSLTAQEQQQQQQQQQYCKQNFVVAKICQLYCLFKSCFGGQQQGRQQQRNQTASVVLNKTHLRKQRQYQLVFSQRGNNSASGGGANCPTLQAATTQGSVGISGAVRAVVLLFPLFGLHYTLTGHYISFKTCYLEEFQRYAFVTIDGIQGALVSVIFCYATKEARKVIKQFVFGKSAFYLDSNKRTANTSANNYNNNTTNSHKSNHHYRQQRSSANTEYDFFNLRPSLTTSITTTTINQTTNPRTRDPNNNHNHLKQVNGSVSVNESQFSDCQLQTGPVQGGGSKVISDSQCSGRQQVISVQMNSFRTENFGSNARNNASIDNTGNEQQLFVSTDNQNDQESKHALLQNTPTTPNTNKPNEKCNKSEILVARKKSVIISDDNKPPDVTTRNNTADCTTSTCNGSDVCLVSTTSFTSDEKPQG